MSRMLPQLAAVLDDIEKEDDWAHKFVTDILERREKNPGYKLTGKQFEKLNEIHKRFVLGW